MPLLLSIFAVVGAILILVAILPQLEVRMPRRYRDIIYFRLRRHGGRIDVWRGKPVKHALHYEFEWSESEQAAFDADGLPVNPEQASRHVRQKLRSAGRRFPFAPILVLHAIDKAMGGLAPDDRRKLDALGVELGDQVLVGDLPNAFPERAFHELRENGLGPWGEN
jgi:hypothetical protein